MSDRVHLVNPLGGALHHYQSELESVLQLSGHTVTGDSIVEPSLSGRRPLRWLLDGYRAVFRARVQGASRIILLWPMAGFLDVVALQVLAGRRATVIFHDPKPLVHAVGYGRLLRWIARRCHRVTLLVHSDAAAADMSALGFPRTVLVPHPIQAGDRPRGGTRDGSVVVLGQYKPDRDVELLEELAATLPGGTSLRICGRGWPEVPGWTVVDRFLAEDELDAIMETAGVVLIPYRRFYQSGIAIRALEAGAGVVGPAGTSMDSVLASAPDLLAHGSAAAEWSRAVQAALSLTSEQRVALLGDYHRNVVESWSNI